MRIVALVTMTLLLAGPAHATQEYILPTLFDVTDVSREDVLNIRSQPNAGAEIIGTLAPDARGIEIVEERKGWGRVNSGEGTGWVSMRYLNYRTDVWMLGALPDGFRCIGTEPFWSLQVEDDSVVYQEPDQKISEPVRAILDTGIFRDPSRVVLGESMTLVARPQICSDGMSDRLYGLMATLVRTDAEPTMQIGCCLIQP